MNNSKIATALRLLAEAFETPAETAPEQPKPSGKGKTKAAVDVSAAAAAPATAATTTAVVEQAAPTAPTAPAITQDQLNKAVLKVAAKNRDRAVAILGTFGLSNTVGLAPEKFQAVYDAFEEEIAKQDAAAVQVQQASLV